MSSGESADAQSLQAVRGQRDFAAGIRPRVWRRSGSRRAAVDSMAAALGGLQQPLPARRRQRQGHRRRDLRGDAARRRHPQCLRHDGHGHVAVFRRHHAAPGHPHDPVDRRIAGDQHGPGLRTRQPAHGRAVRAGRGRAEHAQQSLQRVEGSFRHRRVCRRPRRRVPGPQRLRADGRLDRAGRPSSPSGTGRWTRSRRSAR